MIAEVVNSFEYSIGYLKRALADVSESEMVAQPTRVPTGFLANHASWTVGHLIHSCQGISEEFRVEPWLPDDWEERFGCGSTPSAIASDYPSKEELLSLLDSSAQRLRTTLESVPVQDYDKVIPDEPFTTMGQVILHVVVAHTAYHIGQLAQWRRALGKPSAGVYI